ncbi:hypothetical protein IID22_04605 [Patescibacteria group bacterium]|nr:hypothetical protein [Patescibacteria group bacterium]
MAERKQGGQFQELRKLSEINEPDQFVNELQRLIETHGQDTRVEVAGIGSLGRIPTDRAERILPLITSRDDIPVAINSSLWLSSLWDETNWTLKSVLTRLERGEKVALDIDDRAVEVDKVQFELIRAKTPKWSILSVDIYQAVEQFSPKNPLKRLFAEKKAMADYTSYRISLQNPDSVSISHEHSILSSSGKYREVDLFGGSSLPTDWEGDISEVMRKIGPLLSNSTLIKGLPPNYGEITKYWQKAISQPSGIQRIEPTEINENQ